MRPRRRRARHTVVRGPAACRRVRRCETPQRRRKGCPPLVWGMGAYIDVAHLGYARKTLGKWARERILWAKPECGHSQPKTQKGDGIMGWSFRKSIKVAPGVRINFSKSGVSTSIGVKGLTYNTRGRVTASIPGTGIRFTQHLNSQRTSRPISSVVAGSSRVAPVTAERLSKREQATRDFVLIVQSRTSVALLQYFVSHGVYVAADDLSDAVTLEEHQPFLETLSREFEVTTKAIRLALDIGSISLAEKEKAMSAVYEIERKCVEHHGTLGELETASGELLSTVRAWPKAPGFMAPLLIGLLGCFLGVPVGLVVIVFALALSVYRAVTFKRRKSAAAMAIDEANQRFESLLNVEVTPRPAVTDRNDIVSLKVAGFGVVILAAAIYVLVVSQRQSTDKSGAPIQAATTDAPVVATAPANTGRSGADFSWLVGKYPSDVVNDRRFRSAFQGISRPDWGKISERLVVTDSAGIQSKDGYLVAWGCKAHSCGTDRAAFAISEATGKGDLVFSETPASSSNAVVKGYQWPELPITKTPLADWARENGMDIGATVAASPAPLVQASFDCTKARSDAEHIICGDPELAANDVELAAIYAKAMAAAKDPVAFKERTRAQWNYRERECHDRECVARWYADQKVVLSEIANTGDTAAQ